MGMMVEGEWVSDPELKELRGSDGSFVRKPTAFREWVTADGSSGFPAEAGRYHLYVSRACPWAHRATILRSLKGLEGAISLSSVAPFMGAGGWEFGGKEGDFDDPLHGSEYLREIYARADPTYTGRVSTPVLWDRQRETIVNNESRDIARMLDKEFDALAEKDLDLCPADLGEKVDATIDAIYEPVNNGVYRSGFATTQEAYEEAVTDLFDALDHWDGVLGKNRYLCGNRLTEADIFLFTTLVRFDAVYHGHFKCNLRRIEDYPHLSGYLRELYQTPGVAETVDIPHIKHHYYMSHESVNPTRIIPKGPVLNLDAPHGRDRFGG